MVSTACDRKRAAGTRLAIAAIVAVGSLAAQSDERAVDLPRARVFGLVRTPSGDPWVGATVHLLARPVGEDERIGRPDSLTTVTDERGRFRTDIADGRPYTAWAVGDIGDETFRATAPVENVFPSVPVLLRELDRPRPRCSVEIEGLDAWAARAPFRLFATSSTRNVVHRELELEDGARAALPPWPGDSVRIEIFGKSGLPIFDGAVPTTGSYAAIEVSPPTKGRFAVRDIFTEKGVGGASLWVAVRDRMFQIGRTDDDGFAEIELSEQQSRSSGLFAMAPGHAPAPVQRGDETRRNGEWPALREGVTPNLHVHVGAGYALEGRILLAPGRPARQLALIAECAGLHYVEKNSRHLRRFRQLFRTDDDGRFRIPSVLAEYPIKVHAVLDDAHIAALPEEWQRGVWPIVYGLVAPLRNQDPGDVGDRVLRDACPVELSIRTVEGVPADRAELSIMLADVGHTTSLESLPLMADRSGRALLLVPDGSEPVLTIRSGGNWAMFRLVVARARGVLAPAEVTVQMREPLFLAGRVVRAGGGPVAGLRVTCYPTGSPRQPAVSVREELEPDAEHNRAEVRTVSDYRVLRSLMRSTTASMPVTTDERGGFSIAVPRAPMTYRLQTPGARIDVEVDGDRSILDIELELAR